MTTKSALTAFVSLRTSRVHIAFALIVAIIAAVVGGAESLRDLRTVTDFSGKSDVERRLPLARTYGFGLACAPRLLVDAQVLLANPFVGPGEQDSGLPGFDPDASGFAYPMLPRIVQVEWDFSQRWTPDTRQVDYIALWQQTELRTPAEAQAATDARQTLDAGWSNSVVCSYADEQGAMGTVYAVSARAIREANSATLVQPALGLESPRDDQVFALVLGRVVLGLLSLWCIGALLISAVLRRQSVPRAYRLGLALPLGCMAVSVELTALSLLRINWELGTALVPWICLALYLAVSARRPGWRGVVGATARLLDWRGATVLEGVGIAGIVLISAAALSVAPFGLAEYDGFTTGLFKAALLSSARSVLPIYDQAATLFYAQPAHPPLIAIVLNWLWLFGGTVDEHATLILWPALLCSGWALVYALVRQVAPRRIAVWLVLGVAICASDLIKIATLYGYADLPVAIFLLGGTCLLWLQSQRVELTSRLSLIAGAMFAGAAWSKEEGLVAGGAAIFILGLLTWWRSLHRDDRGGRWYPVLYFALAWTLTLLPLVIIRVIYPVPSVILHAAGLGHVFSERMPVIVAGFAARIVQHWFLPISVILVAFWQLGSRNLIQRHLTDARFLVPSALIGIQLVADMVAIGFNPLEVHDEMAVAAGRLLAQLTLLVYVVAIGFCAAVFNHSELAKSVGHTMRRSALMLRIAPLSKDQA